MSQENSERIGMNCEEKALDGIIEPSAIHSARMVTITMKLATEIDITDYRLTYHCGDDFTKY